MIKKLTSILLSVLVLTSLLRDFSVIAYFNIYQDVISKTLCINRTRVQSSCHGKCFLKQQLEENHQPTDQKPITLQEDKSNLFVLPNLPSSVGLNPEPTRCTILFTSRFFDQEFSASWFHPPEIRTFRV